MPIGDSINGLHCMHHLRGPAKSTPGGRPSEEHAPSWETILTLIKTSLPAVVLAGLRLHSTIISSWKSPEFFAMRSNTLLAAAALVGATTAHAVPSARAADKNPFVGRKLSISHDYADKLEETFDSFIARNDTLNAAKVRTVQNTGTFRWAPAISLLPTLDASISAARAEQNQGGVPQVLGLVLYNLPDRDCSAGESAGELSGRDGLRRYKAEYVDGWYERLRRASDITFAIVVEPDAIGNMVTNQGIPLCADAKAIQEEGIAYALKKLQLPNVHLYLDASHGGWLGWADNLPLGTYLDA